MAYYCYMVLCSNGGYYTGWTTDPIRRLKQHNAGLGARYTRMNSPCQLVYIEEVADRSTALKRELQIKMLKHPKKVTLCANATLNILSQFSVDPSPEE